METVLFMHNPTIHLGHNLNKDTVGLLSGVSCIGGDSPIVHLLDINCVRIRDEFK